MTTTTPKTKAAPKKPQDHQPTKSDQMRDDAAPPAGHELMRQATELRSGEIAEATADIADLYAELGIDMMADNREKIEIESTPATLRVLGKFGALLEKYSVDPVKFAKFDTGPKSSTRTADLAMWYLGELGKSDSSAS